MNTSVIHSKGPGGHGGRSTRALSIAKLMDIQEFRAIDLGSNTGYNSFDLYECGCKEVVGIEIRDEYLAIANQEKAHLGYTNINFLKLDVRKVDEFNLGKFDICLSSGLLYHMQNPFNLLKRIRNIARYLALETHISPSLLNMFRCGRKYRKNLTLKKYRVFLDDIPFTGRLNIFPIHQDMTLTSGSINSHVTFWLDKKSIMTAIKQAGFRIIACYFEKTPGGLPPIYIDHGYRRTKIFILAEAQEHNEHLPVRESVIRGCSLLSKHSDNTSF